MEGKNATGGPSNNEPAVTGRAPVRSPMTFTVSTTSSHILADQAINEQFAVTPAHSSTNPRNAPAGPMQLPAPQPLSADDLTGSSSVGMRTPRRGRGGSAHSSRKSNYGRKKASSELQETSQDAGSAAAAVAGGPEHARSTDYARHVGAQASVGQGGNRRRPADNGSTARPESFLPQQSGRSTRSMVGDGGKRSGAHAYNLSGQTEEDNPQSRAASECGRQVLTVSAEEVRERPSPAGSALQQAERLQPLRLADQTEQSKQSEPGVRARANSSSAAQQRRSKFVVYVAGTRQQSRMFSRRDKKQPPDTSSQQRTGVEPTEDRTDQQLSHLLSVAGTDSSLSKDQQAGQTREANYGRQAEKTGLGEGSEAAGPSHQQIGRSADYLDPADNQRLSRPVNGSFLNQSRPLGEAGHRQQSRTSGKGQQWQARTGQQQKARNGGRQQPAGQQQKSADLEQQAVADKAALMSGEQQLPRSEALQQQQQQQQRGPARYQQQRRPVYHQQQSGLVHHQQHAWLSYEQQQERQISRACAERRWRQSADWLHWKQHAQPVHRDGQQQHNGHPDQLEHPNWPNQARGALRGQHESWPNDEARLGQLAGGSVGQWPSWHTGLISNGGEGCYRGSLNASATPFVSLNGGVPSGGQGSSDALQAFYSSVLAAPGALNNGTLEQPAGDRASGMLVRPYGGALSDFDSLGDIAAASGYSPALSDTERRSYHLDMPSTVSLVRPAGQSSESQREMLIKQLWQATLECMICYCVIRADVAVWSCSSCYHIFHFYCIRKWAVTAAEGSTRSSWRCPACQHQLTASPSQYMCFCGRLRDPPLSRHDTPHSCGELCSRKPFGLCIHACTVLCHPGPCPPCLVMVVRSCDCGKTQEKRTCSHTAPLKCANPCGKVKSCGRHVCEEVCHSGSCPPCKEQLVQACHCQHPTSREVTCATVGPAAKDWASFSCGSPCSKLLGCGSHMCPDVCHQGPCAPCSRAPSAVTRCPCGRRELASLPGAVPRSSCTDPVPTCEQQCRKRLPCGGSEDSPGKEHVCLRSCHEDGCGPCPGKTSVPCRCGSETMEVACSSLKAGSDGSKAPEFLCTRRCNAKKSCGRHKCNEACCPERGSNEPGAHMCLQVCGRLLSCGEHHCDDLCHRGQCGVCHRVSFNELRCHCNAEVIYPPVPCGTKPPVCSRLCQRVHGCDHPVMHTCHPDDESCPPCAVLTEKWCMGQHEKRKNVPCYLADVSCGLSCAKLLSCGVHKCVKPCHKGDCITTGKTCEQPCLISRSDCGHACGHPCHHGKPCPRSPCRDMVTLKCICGSRTAKVQCNAGSSNTAFARVSAGVLALKLSQAGSGQDIDPRDVIPSAPGAALERHLECNEQCSLIERNRRMALALEIENPDLQAKLGAPAYSIFLKNMAKREPPFIVRIETALEDLVMNAKLAKLANTQLIHSFPSMKYEHRRAIHELAPFYGCTTRSQDEEPNRSVVVSAIKGKCWMPSITLTIAACKDIRPKFPMPIPHDAADESAVRARASELKSKLEANAAIAAGEVLDYFDETG